MKQKSNEIQCSEEESNALGIVLTLNMFRKDPETGEIIISEDTKIKPDLEGLKVFSNLRFQNKITHWEELLVELTQKNLLILEDNIYSLTEQSRQIGKETRTRWVSKWFDDILIRCTKSEAYALFCEKVFGKNLYQFNGLDMEQLETMIDYLKLQPDELVLDLGCGPGKVDEYISEKTSARFIGIDISEKAIDWAKKEIQSKNKNIEFQVHDINNLKFPPSTFDAIISIDSFYYIEDFDLTIQKLKKLLKPKGQMGVFYAQFRPETESIEILKSKNTKLGKALIKNNLEFEVLDFTDNARNLWQRELATAEELKEMFESEGNQVLYEDRVADSKNTIKSLENNQQRRFFYHIKLRN